MTSLQDKEPSLEDLILALRRNLVGHIQRSPEKSDLSPMQFEMVLFLQDAKEATMEEIAHHFRIKAPSATSHISELEKKGLILRTSRPNDRRIVCISLTKNAQDQIQSIRRRKRALYQKFFSKLSKQDVDELKRILLKLLKP